MPIVAARGLKFSCDSPIAVADILVLLDASGNFGPNLSARVSAQADPAIDEIYYGHKLMYTGWLQRFHYEAPANAHAYLRSLLNL